MKSMKFIVPIAAAALCAASFALAAEVTNLGRTTTVTLMSETANAGTEIRNESVVPQAGTDRRGLYVFTYTVPAAGVTGVVDLVDWEIPKGTILLEDAVIEVNTAILPTNGTAAVACGGITILADGSTLESTGIAAAVATAGITTADDKPYITIAGTTATSGVFTVYLPVILGNAQ